MTFWEKATITTAPIEETTPGNPATDLETLLSDPATATREETVTSVAAARAWLQANLDYVVPAGMKKDDIKIEAAKRNILFITGDEARADHSTGASVYRRDLSRR